jgi:hypothetical protein
MVRPDTGNFNRLLTSLGLVCLGAALVVPYFYFRSTSVLETTRIELDRLTPTAQDALTGRQAGIAALEAWVIALAITLALIGLALVIVGAIRLKKAQDSEDEEAELRKDRARAEIRGLTPAEEERKATIEAEQDEVVDEEGGDGGQPTEPESAPSAPGSAPPELPIEPLSEEDEPRQRRLEPRLERAESRVVVTRKVILRVERRVNDIFLQADLGGFEFSSNLGIRSKIGQIEIDGLFTAASSKQENVVLELKVLRNGRTVHRNARNRAEQALATVARFNSVAVEHAAIWLVMIVAEEGIEEATGTDLLKAEEIATQFMLNRGAATVIREPDLDLLPQRFSSLARAGRFAADFI